MYERATKADVSLVGGTLLTLYALLQLLVLGWEDPGFYQFLAAGAGLLVLGFLLDWRATKTKQKVDLGKLGPRVKGFIEEATLLMGRGGKALEVRKYNKALQAYRAAEAGLETAQGVLGQMKDKSRLETVRASLEEARLGSARARVGLAVNLSKKALRRYDRGKYVKAKELYTQAREFLVLAGEQLDVSVEMENLESNLENCEKRLAEEELDTLLASVEEKELYYDDYMKRKLLFDARELLNSMEVEVQQATELAEKFGFVEALQTLNQTLTRLRLGKERVDRAILARLRAKEQQGEEIQPLLDKVDPSLRDVAVDMGENVALYSGYDFRSGAVRLQYTVHNSRDTTISEMKLRLLKDQRLIDVVKVSPNYPWRFNELEMGSLLPGEKRSVNIYLDPMVCGEIPVDATLSYLDAEGSYQSVQAARKQVLIPEPELGSGKNVNSSYLTGLMDEGKSRAQRLVTIPRGLEPDRGLALLMEVLGDTGFSRVWSREDAAGYHGLCQGEECGVTVSLEGRQLELWAVSLGEEGVTPLLTSVSSAIRERLGREGHKAVNISLTIQDSVINRSNISLG